MNISLLYYLSNSAGGGSWDYSGIDIVGDIITIPGQKRSFVSSAHISEYFPIFLRFVLRQRSWTSMGGFFAQIVFLLVVSLPIGISPHPSGQLVYPRRVWLLPQPYVN